MCKSCNSAHNNHDKDQCTSRKEPVNYFFVVFHFRCQVERSRDLLKLCARYLSTALEGSIALFITFPNLTLQLCTSTALSNHKTLLLCYFFKTNPSSSPFLSINSLAASYSLGIVPSRIASLIASLMSPISLEGFSPKVVIISSPLTGG